MKKTLSYVFILIAASLWGCIGLFYKQLTALGMTPLQVVFLRVATATVLMAVYIAVRRPAWFRIRLRDCWMFVGTGVISLSFFNFCYFQAMDSLSLSVAAVLLYTAPIFVMLFSAVLFHERLTVRKLIALALTTVGCVLVTGALFDAKVTAAGVLFGLGAGIGYALYTVFGVYALRRYETETVTFYTFLFSALSVLPLCGIKELSEIAAAFPLESSIYSLCIGFVACLLPYLFYTKGLSGVQAGQASVIATLEPVVAAVIGFAVFGEEATVWKFGGMLLILSAILLLNISIKGKKDKTCNGKS